MKLIPKYLNPFGPIIDWTSKYYKLFDLDNILSNTTWNNNWNRVSIDNGQIKLGDLPWKNLNINKNNIYSFYKDAPDLNNNEFYLKFTQRYINNNELTDLGKNYMLGYIDNTEDGNYKNLLLKIRDSEWKFPESGIHRGNRTFKTWNEYLFDPIDGIARNLIAGGHNMTDGIVGVGSDNKLYNFDSNISQYITRGITFNESKNKALLSKIGSNTINFYDIGNENNGVLENLNTNLPYKAPEDIFKYSNLSDDDKATTKLNPNVLKDYELKDYDPGKVASSIVAQIQKDKEAIESGDEGLRKWDEYNKKNGSTNKGFSVNPYTLQGLRVFIDNLFNTQNTEKLIDNLGVALKNYTPIGRQVHGDYVAQQQAQREAARLINRPPVTSNAQIQSAIDLEAIQKGNQIIEGGNLRDAQVYWNTAEAALQQSKENTMKLDDLANFNRNALVDLKNKIAELRFLTNIKNMLNWDKFMAEGPEYDLLRHKQIEDAKRILRNEAYEDWFINNYNVDKTELQSLSQQYENLVYAGKYDSPEAIQLKNKIDKLNRQYTILLMYNRFKLYGWPTDELEKNWAKSYTFKDGIVTPISKLGGKLKLLQNGGGIGVDYTSVGHFSPYDLLYGKGGTGSSSSEKKSSKSSSSGDSEDEKTKTLLMKSIAETLKGVDGLDSDVNLLSLELLRFFDYTKYSLDDDPSKFYSMYVRALTRVNQVKQSAKRFDASFKQLEQTNSLNAPAITNTGKVIVGVGGTTDMESVSVEEYFKNTDKYHLITNGELLELRRRTPGMAFADKYITEAAQNGTSLQEVEKYVKEFITGLGLNEQNMDVLTRQFGTQGLQGLLTLQKLVQGGFTDAETALIIASLNGLGEYNISTTNQASQIQQALLSIFSFMPPNMRTILSLYSGGEKNALNVVLGLITKGTGTKLDFKINGFTLLDERGLIATGSTKSGSGSSSGGSDKDPKESTATKWAIRGFGEKRTFDIVGNGQSAWRVTGNTMPITDDSEKKVGLTTLVDVSRAFGGTLDLEHAFMGNSRISSLALSLILVETGDITRVALPIDINTPDYKRPWFDRLKSVSDADAELQREGIDATSENLTNDLKSRVNQVYYNHKLPDKFNSDGSLNELKYAYFGLVKGMAKQSSFEDDSDEFNRDYLIKATDKERDQFKQAMTSLGDKNFKIDNGSLWGLLGGEEVYRGTIFIPIRTNIHNTQSGFGTTYSATPGQDTVWETLQLLHDAIEEKGGAVPITKTNFDQ